jgi:hypothetical protein
MALRGSDARLRGAPSCVDRAAGLVNFDQQRRVVGRDRLAFSRYAICIVDLILKTVRYLQLCSLNLVMNRRLLSKNIGQQLRLRPVPWRVDENGHRLPDKDDLWTLDAVDDHPARVRIHNIATGHSAELASDNVLEWRSPGFLLLHCQLILRPRAVDIEPIHRGSPLFPQPPTPDSVVQETERLAELDHLRSALRSMETRQRQLERSQPCPKCGNLTDRAICPNCRLILR